MITSEMRAEMRRLVLVERWRIETVARRFGVHHSTVRRALPEKPPADEKAPQLPLFGPEAHARSPGPRLGAQPGEGAAADEGDPGEAEGRGSGSVVRRVVGELGREEGEQAALHAIARHVLGRTFSRESGVAARARELVRFVQADHPGLGPGHVTLCCLDQSSRDLARRRIRCSPPP